MNNIVEFKNVYKKYGKLEALKGIDLKIPRGKIVGLLGPNGSGKTTMIKIMNGLLTTAEGEVLINGMKPGIETKKIVSYLPERTYLNDWMRVKDIIDFFKDFYEDFDEIKALQMLRTLDIDENRKLKRLLKIKRKVNYAQIGAEIIGYNPSKWGQSIIINRGKIDNIKVGDPVISHEGVVGQVINVSPNTSKVLILIDRTSAIDVFLQQSRARGVIIGGGNELCQLKYILKNNDTKIGDKVLTSGLDGIFPKGLLVGHVADLSPIPSGLFDTIKVMPIVDFTKLEFVTVLKLK